MAKKLEKKERPILLPEEPKGLPGEKPLMLPPAKAVKGEPVFTKIVPKKAYKLRKVPMSLEEAKEQHREVTKKLKIKKAIHTFIKRNAKKLAKGESKNLGGQPELSGLINFHLETFFDTPIKIVGTGLFLRLLPAVGSSMLYYNTITPEVRDSLPEPIGAAANVLGYAAAIVPSFLPEIISTGVFFGDKAVTKIKLLKKDAPENKAKTIGKYIKKKLKKGEWTTKDAEEHINWILDQNETQIKIHEAAQKELEGHILKFKGKLPSNS